MLEGVKLDHAEKDIGALHDSLFSRGIFTKSMLKTYARCPLQFEQRYVEGHREAPGFALAYGVVGHSLMEQWGKRMLEGKGYTLEEAQQHAREAWAKEMVGIQPPKGHTKEERLATLMSLFQEYNQRLGGFRLGKIEAVEVPLGYEGDLFLGAVPVAGHLDAVWTQSVVDYKVCTSTSPYLAGPMANVLELVFQHALTGKPQATLITMQHDRKTQRSARVKKHGGKVTKEMVDVGTEIAERTVEAIKAGMFPPIHQIGKYPCNPKWCGFFGRECPVTRHLKREDFE